MIKVLTGIFLLISCLSRELIYLSELLRHGARYPVYPYYDYLDTIRNAGELTPVGMRQHQNLGNFIKRQYIERIPFLSQNFDINEYSAVSTTYHRTIESIFSQLYGIYPNNSQLLIPKGIQEEYLKPPYDSLFQIDQIEDNALPHSFQPIPVKNGDDLLQNCYNYLYWEQKMVQQNIQAYVNIISQYQTFILKLQNILNLKDYQLNLMSLIKVYDTLVCDQFLGRSIPLNAQDMLNFRHLYHYYYMIVHSGMYARILSSALFPAIISKIDMKLNNPESFPEKIGFYSGHDSNISPTLSYLNFSSYQCIQDRYSKADLSKYLNCQQGPDFAANIIFEIYKQNNQKATIKILYNGKYMNLCQRHTQQCDYFEWKSRIEFQYVDYNTLCALNNSNKNLQIDE